MKVSVLKLLPRERSKKQANLLRGDLLRIFYIKARSADCPHGLANRFISNNKTKQKELASAGR